MAAVLVSLAATSIAVNGGASMSMEDGLNFDSIKDLEVSPRSVGAFTGLVDRPTADTNVEANLGFNGSTPQEIKLRSATLEPGNLTDIRAGNKRINSDGSVSIYGFKGTVKLGKPVEIDGKAKGVVSNGVNVSGEFKIDEKVSTNSMELRDVEGSVFRLDNVQGTIRSGSTSAKVSDGELSMNAFTGNMSFDLQNNRMNFTGEVATLEAGSFSLG